MGHAVTLGMCVCVLAEGHLLKRSLPCWGAWESGHPEAKARRLPTAGPRCSHCPLSHWSWTLAPPASALPDTAGEERVACRPTCFCFLCLDLVKCQQLCCLHKEHHCSPLQCGGEASSEKQMPSALPWRLPVAEAVRAPADGTAHGTWLRRAHDCQQAPLGASYSD